MSSTNVATPESSADSKPRYPGEASTTNMGHTEGKEWPYTIISKELFDSEYQRLGRFGSYANGADSVTFQPHNPVKNQDRLAVQEWDLKNGKWTFAAVFDGHGGDAAVEYVIEAVPGDLKGRLSSLVSFASSTSVAVEPHAVSAVIQQALSTVDDRITQDLKDIIPGGVEQLAKMTDDDIKRIINDQDQGSINAIKLRRALSGSTALIALQDPSKENLWIAGLGDCSAILAFKNASGAWSGELLTEVHNGLDEGEKARVRAEHPGEDEAILGYRVLGCIMVTRALGDQSFKVPKEYVTRMFLNANPPLVTRAATVEEWVPRILTPPYITNRAAIQHRKLEPGTEAVLVLSSDGMTDLLAPTTMMLTPQLINDLAQHIGKVRGNGDSLSQQLLKYAMGGDDIKKASQHITVDMDGGAWMDDTTVVCLPL